MKQLKKVLCVFLTAIFLFSAVSVGITAFAEDSSLDEAYEALAYQFFTYTEGAHGKVLTKDDRGIIIPTILGNLDNYTISNEQGKYTYSDSHGFPIRSFAYNHTVTAKDNEAGTIRGAMDLFYGIVNSANVISYTQGRGFYTIDRVAKAVKRGLKDVKNSEDDRMFFDGRSYIVNGFGELEYVTDFDTYFLNDNGDVVYYNVFNPTTGALSYNANKPQVKSLKELLTATREVIDEDEEEDSPNRVKEEKYVIDGPGQLAEISKIFQEKRWNEQVLWDYMNVDAVINYFCGNCTSVNDGNWFHNYQFRCKTDIDTILSTAELTNRPILVRDVTLDWTMDRIYDESGTKADYVNLACVKTDAAPQYNNIRQDLSMLKGTFQSYFSYYYEKVNGTDNSRIELLNNTDLMNTEFNNIRTFFNTFNSLSSKAKINCFGDQAYNYMNLVTQLTPVSVMEKYLPSRTVGEFVDSSNNPVKYQVTNQKVTGVVEIIDSLITNPKIGGIIQNFLSPTDPESFIYGVDDCSTVEKMLQGVIKKLVYQDSIINLILTKVYPLVTNLLDDKITDSFVSGLLNNITGVKLVDNAIESLAESIIGTNSGWQATIYRVLADNGIALTPAGVAMIMSKSGYGGYFPGIITALTNAKGGTISYGGYANVIGKEGDAYCLDRWKDVNPDTLVWGINGDVGKFKQALSCVLSPLVGLLAAALGDIEHYELKVGEVLGGDLCGRINHSKGYSMVLGPLFEALGITAEEHGLVSAATFSTHANNVRNNASSANITQLINDIVDPLLRWINETVIPNPITTVLSLIPNVSYFLASGAAYDLISNFKIDICLRVGQVYKSDKAIYTVNIAELLGDTMNMLTSLDNLLSEVLDLGAETGKPILGYTVTYQLSGGSTVTSQSIFNSKDDANLYARQNGAVMSSIKYNDVTEYYTNASRTQKALYETGDCNILVTGIAADGSLDTDVVIKNVVAYSNASGVVRTDNELTQEVADSLGITLEELKQQFSNRVYVYYKYYRYTNDKGNVVTSPSSPGSDYAYDTIKTLQKPAEGINYEKIFDAEMEKESIALPPIMDRKLWATGTITEASSVRNVTVNADGSQWASGRRKYIKMTLLNNGVEENSVGFVMLYIFRYLFGAINVRMYDNETQTFGKACLLDSFGLGDTLTNDIFSGLTIQDIVNNITLNPDASIAALWELFAKNEFGSLYKIDPVTKKAVPGTRYTYYMDPVNYHYDEMARYIPTDSTFGTGVRYSQYWTAADSEYVIGNIDSIAESVLSMLKLEDISSLSGFLQGYVNDYVCNDKVISNLVFRLYDFLAELGLEGVFKNALGIDYSKTTVVNALKSQFGDNYGPALAVQEDITRKVLQYKAEGMTDAEAREKAEYTYDRYTFYREGMNELGEDVWVPSDWGFTNTEFLNEKCDGKPEELLLRALSAAYSPFAILVRYFFLGEDISAFDLITIPTYDGYYYSWGPLMEGLSADDGLISYQSYYEYVYSPSYTQAQRNYNCLYYFAKPLIALVSKIIADPIKTVLSLIPNLLFFINIGAFTEVVNNLIHTIYVLVDVFDPIYDIRGLANKFLSNLEVAGMTLNLGIPLDVDFNSLINTLLNSVIGDLFPMVIENKNIVTGTHTEEKEQIKLDSEGNTIYALDEYGFPILNESGDPIPVVETVEVEVEEYQKAELSIEIPYFDLTSLCVGSLETYVSPSTNLNAIKLASVDSVEFGEAGTQSSSGTDLVTFILRFAFDALLLESNSQNIEKFLVQFADLNSEDAGTLNEVLVALRSAVIKYEIVDQGMGAVLKLLKLLIPIVGSLGERFKDVDFSITDVIGSISEPAKLIDYVKALMNAGSGTNMDPDTSNTISGISKLFSKIAAFFKKLVNFFKSLFSGM